MMQPWVKLVLLSVIFVMYLCGGAFIFNILETTQEKYLYQRAKIFYNTYRGNHHCISHEDFRELAVESYTRYRGDINWDIVNNDSEWKSSFKWSLSNSVFFSATVITTIGYGNLSPRSYFSRISVLPFALIGIPLTGLLLGAIGQCLETQWKALAHRLFDLLSCIKSPSHRKVWCLVFMVIGTYSLVIALPAIVFAFTEEWNFFDAHYYTFISLSTIGFGDYVAGSASKRYKGIGEIIYRLLIIVYIVTGLSVLTILFRVVQEYQEKQGGKVKSLTRNVTTKVIRSHKKNAGFRGSDFSADVDNNVNSAKNNGISLTKVSFNHIDTICSDIYKTDSSGDCVTIDRATQTEPQMISLLQEYNSKIMNYRELPKTNGDTGLQEPNLDENSNIAVSELIFDNTLYIAD